MQLRIFKMEGHLFYLKTNLSFVLAQEHNNFSFLLSTFYKIVHETAHDKTYKKTCVTSRLRSVCTFTQCGKGSRLAFFDNHGGCRRHMQSGKTDQTA